MGIEYRTGGRLRRIDALAIPMLVVGCTLLSAMFLPPSSSAEPNYLARLEHQGFDFHARANEYSVAMLAKLPEKDPPYRIQKHLVDLLRLHAFSARSGLTDDQRMMLLQYEMDRNATDSNSEGNDFAEDFNKVGHSELTQAVFDSHQLFIADRIEGEDGHFASVGRNLFFASVAQLRLQHLASASYWLNELVSWGQQTTALDQAAEWRIWLQDGLTALMMAAPDLEVGRRYCASVPGGFPSGCPSPVSQNVIELL